MSRHLTLTGLTLALLLTLTSLTLVANAQWTQWSHVLTPYFYQGSTIEIFLNMTELNEIALSGLTPPVTVFSFNLLDTASFTETIPLYVKAKIIDSSGNKITCYLSGIKLRQTTNDRFEEGYFYLFAAAPSYVNSTYRIDVVQGPTPNFVQGMQHDVLAVVTARGQNKTKIILTTFMKGDELTTLVAGPGADECKDWVKKHCGAGYCKVRLIGLYVPMDVSPQHTTYAIQVVVKAGTAPKILYLAGVINYLPLSWNNLNTNNAVAIKMELYGGANALAVGRKLQVIKFEEGEVKITGLVNITLNVSALPSDINFLTTRYNYTILLTFVAEPYGTLAELGAWYYPRKGYKNVTTEGLLNYTRRIIVGGQEYTDTKTLYGLSVPLGAYNYTDAHNHQYLNISFTVNPQYSIPYFNKLYTLVIKTLAGETKRIYVPAVELQPILSIKRIQSIPGTPRTISWIDVGAPAGTHGVLNFTVTIYSVKLPEKLVVFPGSLLPPKHAVWVNVAGDKDVINVYDIINVTLVNLPSRGAEFAGIGVFDNTKNNVTLPAYLLFYGRYIAVGEAYITNAAGVFRTVPFDASTTHSYAYMKLNYTIQDAPYGGNFYSILPLIQLNLTTGSGYVNYTFAWLPPVNVTDVYTDLSSEIASSEIAREAGQIVAFRIRPYAAAIIPTKFETDLITTESSDTVAPTGYFIVVYGIGFNTTDANLFVQIGNATIPLSTLRKSFWTNVADDLGRFITIIPLYKLVEEGYKIFKDNVYTGRIKIFVNGTGANSDVVGGYKEVPESGVGYTTYQIFEIKYGKDVSWLKGFMVLVDPRVHKLDTCAWASRKTTATWYVERCAPRAWIYLNDTHSLVKINYDAYKKAKELGYEAAPTLKSEAYMEIVVIGYGMPSVPEGAIYKITFFNSSNVAVLNLTDIPAEALVKGFVHLKDVPVPLLPRVPAGYYEVRVFNGTLGGYEAPVYATRFNIKPTIVVYSKITKDVAVSLWGGRPSEVSAYPGETVEIYGYGWYANKELDIHMTTVATPGAWPVIKTLVADPSGTWTWAYTVKLTYAGKTLFFNVTQETTSETIYVEFRISVRELLRSPLRVSVDTGHVTFESGAVNVPVIAAVTYYDQPSEPTKTHVYVIVYKLEGGEMKPIIAPTEMKVLDPHRGLWYAVLTLDASKPVTYLVVVEAVYEPIEGVQLKQYAVTSVTVEPELKAMVAETSKNAKALLDSVDAISKKLVSVEEKIGDVETKLADIEKSLSKLDKLDEIYKAVTTAKTEILGAIDSLKSSIDTALATVKKEILAAIETAKTDIITEVKGVVAKLDTVTSKIESISGKMDKVVDTVKAFTEDIKEIKEKLGTLDEIYATVTSAKRDILDAISAVKSSLEKAIAGAVDEIREAVKESLGEVSGEIKGYIDTAKEEIVKKVEDVKSSIVAEIKKSAAELSAKIDEKFATLDREIKALAEVTKYLTAEVAGLSKTVADLKSAVSELGSKIETVEGNVKSLEDKLAGIAELVSSISDKLDTALGKLSYLATKVDEVKKAIEDAAAKLEKSVSEIRTEVAAIEKMLGETTSAIKNATKEIKSAMMAAVTEISMKIEDVKKSIVETVTSESSEVITAVKENADKLSGEIEALGNKIDTLSKKLDTVKSDLSKSIESAKEAILAELGKVEKSIADLSKTVATKEDVDKVSKKVDDLSSKLDELKGAISTIADRVESTVKSLSKDISSVASKVSDVSSKVEDVKSAVGSTNSNVMIFGAGSLVVSIIVLVLLIITALRGGLLAAH